MAAERLTELTLDTSGTVVLDANGNGSVKLGPNVGARWKPTVAAVSTSTATKFPTCSIYVGGASAPTQLVDATSTGNGDSTDRIAGTVVAPGHYVWAVWSGGDVGAVATLSLWGTYEMGYR